MFRLAADLREGMLAGEKPARLSIRCRQLTAEVNGHLSHEQHLMSEAAYPFYAWHERQHRTGRARLAALEREVRVGDPQAMFEALEAFAEWLRDHTSVADRMVGSYLRNYWRSQSTVGV